MDPQRLRFRQHLKTEMAHYASDCWDLEIKSSYGWIECVGHADRACYDLQVHSQKSGVPLIAAVTLDKPKQVDYYRLQANRAKIGTTFKQDQKKVLDALATMGNDDEVRSRPWGDEPSEGEATERAREGAMLWGMEEAFSRLTASSYLAVCRAGGAGLPAGARSKG